MRIEEITSESLKSVDNQELRNLRFRFIQLWQRWSDSPDFNVGGLNKQKFLSKYATLLNEYKRRGLAVATRTPLDEAVKLIKSVWGIQADDLPELVVIENFASIGGSYVKDPKEANDLDLIIRSDLRDEGLEIKLGRTIGDLTKKSVHFVYAATGPHSNYIPLYDLVLRPKDDVKVVRVREGVKKGLIEYYQGLDNWDQRLLVDNLEVIKRVRGSSVLDYGCGPGRLMKVLAAIGFFVRGVDNQPTAVDLTRAKGLIADVADAQKDKLPFGDEAFDTAVAVHVVEHLEKPAKVLKELRRVAKERVVIVVPLGPRADITHIHEFQDIDSVKSFLGEGWAVELIGETNSAIAIFDKSAVLKAKLKPFGDYELPKPTMAGLTEAFSVEEIWPWVESRFPIDVEEKLNGLRMVVEKEGDRVRIKTEGNIDRTKQLKDIAEEIRKVPHDLILDCSVGIDRKCRPLPRIKLMTLMADEPELGPDDVIKATIFDMPYLDEPINQEPLRERRKRLEDFYKKYLKGSPHFALTSFNIVNSKAELEKEFKRLAMLPQSEGVVLKTLDGPWEPKSATNEWAKLKKELEIKVIVLERHSVEGGNYNYTCGLLPGQSKFKNLKEFRGEKYINLGRSYNTKIKAEPGDILTIGVEEIIPKGDEELNWLGARVIDIDKDRTKPYYAQQVIDLAERANLLQKASYPGIYLVKPHGTLIIEGDKDLIVKAKPLPDKYIGTEVALVEDKAILGIIKLKEPKEITQEEFKELRPRHQITDEEAKEWGFDDKDKLYCYEFEVVEAFDEPIGYDPPAGVQTVIAEVEFDKREVGNITFQEGDEGEGILQIHIMGLEENEAEALKQANDRVLAARTDPIKLRKVLLEVIGNQGAHLDIRLKREGDDFWQGGEFFIGNIEGLDKLPGFLKGEAVLRAPWKQPHAEVISGKDELTIRGPLSWLEVGAKKVEIFEPGSVGASTNKYAAMIRIDKFKWSMYLAEEHAKKFRFEGGKYLDGNFLFAFVPITEEGKKGPRVWMCRRLSDDDHLKEEIEKHVRGPFGGPGGKFQIADKIVEYIPKHKVYVEPFCEAAAVLFAKKPSEVEILSDIDPEIAFALKYIQGITEEKIQRLEKFNWARSRKIFEELLADDRKDDDDYRFYRFLYLKRASYGYTGLNYQPRKNDERRFKPVFKKFLRYKERLKGVKIYNKDYKEIIKEYDSDETFFYLDPPYFEGWHGKYKLAETPEEFVRILRSIKGKFILSQKKSYKIRKIFSGFNFRTIELVRFYGTPKIKTDEEFIIANFDLKKRRLYSLEKSAYFYFTKVDKKQHIVGGIVYEPDKIDAQGDYTDAEEIQKAMFNFMKKYAEDSNRIKVMHKGQLRRFPILECFQPEEDTRKGNDIIKAGSWWLMIYVPDEDVWQDIEEGKITGFSMGGHAAEEPSQ